MNECDSKCLNGLCENQPGSFTCECPGGFHYNIDEGTCNDDDECLKQPCANGKCRNTLGQSYKQLFNSYFLDFFGIF